MRRELQMIFQDPMTSLDPRQTVNEIIGGPLRLQKMVGSKRSRTSGSWSCCTWWA